jgi:Flp pilus assembly protein TadG
MSRWEYFRARVASYSRFAADTTVEGRARGHRLLQRFLGDQSGSYVLVVALTMPVLVGTAGMGTEAVWWLYKHKDMQSAADSGAVSAATAGSNLAVQANSVTASYGYANGVNNVTVTVNQPPSSGRYTSTPQAVEVVVSQSQPRLLSSLFGNGPVVITARAIAVPNTGTGCVLGLDPTASSTVTISGSNNLNLIGCNLYSNSNASPSLNVSGTATVSANQVGAVGSISGASDITAANGIKTGMRPVSDPYQNVSPPQMLMPCDSTSYSQKRPPPPNVCLSGGITVNGGTLDLEPGIYYLYGKGGLLQVGGNGSLTCSACTGGKGVTLVFTGSVSDGWAYAKIAGGASVTLTAPNSGPTKGIVMYGDRHMPVGTAFNLEGGGTQNFGGAIDLPQAALKFSGGNGTTTSCTQVIADTITFTGSSDLQVNCAALNTSAIGVQTAQLVE